MPAVLKLASADAAKKALAKNPAYQAAQECKGKVEREAAARLEAERRSVLAQNYSALRAKLDPPGTVQERRTRATFRIMLQTKFPKCFAAPGEAKRPIKREIEWDVLAALGVSLGAADTAFRFKIGDAIADYTSGKSYLAVMLPGAERVDLDGNPAGEVDEATAQSVQNRLSKIERREAELARLEQMLWPIAPAKNLANSPLHLKTGHEK